MTLLMLDNDDEKQDVEPSAPCAAVLRLPGRNLRTSCLRWVTGD
jgi:hypothetical protein